MYIRDNESRRRIAEAQKARDNRAEIVKALSTGQISRRDLWRWGLFSASGVLLCKNGLSPFARSAFAAVPTGTPRSPLFGTQKFTQAMPRLRLQTPIPLTRNGLGQAVFPTNLGEPNAKRLSYHTDFTDSRGALFKNPRTKRGPMEGRPPGELFAHQRWEEFFPKVGYVLSLSEIDKGHGLHPLLPNQEANSIWTYGVGKTARGSAPPLLIKARYGEPLLMRLYNRIKDPELPEHQGQDLNRGFGRAETQLHFHNAHNGAESDGAANVHHFPGTFYDYRWSTTLARRDKINTTATDRKASGPDGNGGLVNVAGDFRELQGTMWAHDHRFFFTAENVYKGNL